MRKIYHGSNLVVNMPLVNIGRKNLDFGRGFYVTDFKSQAERWAKIVCKRYPNSQPVLNVYNFDFSQALSDGFRYKKFDSYDAEWLEFVVSNRRGGYEWKSYDIIEGGIANDRVIDTIEAYMEGFITQETALGRLVMHKSNNQIAILNQKIIEHYVTFVESKK